MWIFHGNSEDVLKELESRSFQCVVTSPPYYGLRNYGTGRWEGGFDPSCSHEGARRKTRFDYDLSDRQKGNAGSHVASYKTVCPDCAASYVDEQIGAEPTPDEFI